MEQKPIIQWQRNPVNGFFIFSTFLFLTLTLVLVGARFDFWSAARFVFQLDFGEIIKFKSFKCFFEKDLVKIVLN